MSSEALTGTTDRPSNWGLASLVRPRIAALVMAETAAAFLIERPHGYAALPWLLLGTLLVSAAGCALNHWLERHTDALMPRTADRPLVTGAMSERSVLLFGWGALAAGLAVLWLGTNPLATGIEALAAAIYLGVYTPLKRRTSSNTWVGAIPGALPVLAGGAAASGGISSLALMVFALIFLWQLPHFFAIASMYREQYLGGGLRMLSGEDPKDALLRWQLPIMVMSVVLVSALPALSGRAGGWYALAALAAGLAFLLSAFRFRARADRAAARAVVLTAVTYLPVVLAALVLDVGLGAGGDAPGPAGPLIVTAWAPANDGTGLPVLGELPDFALTDQDGQPFGRADMLGRRWIVDFIYSHCSAECVPMTKRMVELQREDLPARFLSVSVDAVRDAPRNLAEYRETWSGGDSRWTLLAGTHDAVMSLSNDGFRLSAGVSEVEEPMEGMPVLFHSQRFALVDDQGRVRGYYVYNDELALEQLRADVAALAAAEE
jgi:protoheme IX farnesyltransferase